MTNVFSKRYLVKFSAHLQSFNEKFSFHQELLKFIHPVGEDIPSGHSSPVVPILNGLMQFQNLQKMFWHNGSSFYLEYFLPAMTCSFQRNYKRKLASNVTLPCQGIVVRALYLSCRIRERQINIVATHAIFLLIFQQHVGAKFLPIHCPVTISIYFHKHYL